MCLNSLAFVTIDDLMLLRRYPGLQNEEKEVVE
jgi:hypothetical protein